MIFFNFCFCLWKRVSWTIVDYRGLSWAGQNEFRGLSWTIVEFRGRTVFAHLASKRVEKCFFSDFFWFCCWLLLLFWCFCCFLMFFWYVYKKRMIFIYLHTFLEFRAKLWRNGCDLQRVRVMCFIVCVCERARAFRGTCARICNRDPKVRKFLSRKKHSPGST